MNKSFSLTRDNDEDTDFESLALTTTESSKDTNQGNLPRLSPEKPGNSITENAGNSAESKFIGPQLPKEIASTTTTQENTTEKFNHEMLRDDKTVKIFFIILF